MKTASVRQVRHEFGEVMQWIADGESVQITKRGQTIAVMTPPPAKRASRKRPDFFARFARIYGKDWRKRLPQENSIVLERRSRSY